MSSASNRIMARALAILAAISIADELCAQQPDPVPVNRPAVTKQDSRPPAEPDDAELAGLPKGSRPERLTWERVYGLALIVSREPRPADGGRLAEAFDAKDFATRSGRLAVADFARFRTEFFAAGKGTGKDGGTFRDPSISYIDLLHRLHSLENSRKRVAIQEGIVAIYRNLIEGASSGLNQDQFDQMDSLLQQGRLSMSEAVTSYRDGLDGFKVELGLSPHAPVVVDRGSLAAFHAVFESVDRWSTDPNRDLIQIPSLVGSLPTLGDVVIDGRSFLGEAKENDDPAEGLLAPAAQVALKNRAARGNGLGPEDSVEQLELRVRRRIRHLSQTRRAYDGEKRRLVLTIRLKNSAFERLIAPPQAEGPGTASRDVVGDLAEQQSQILLVEERLVDLWTSFRAGRLALYRDLGAMPFADWKSFYDQFIAKPGRPVPAQTAPQVRPASPIPEAPPSPTPPAAGR